MLEESLKKIQNSVKLIRQMKDLEFFISQHKGLKTYNLRQLIEKICKNTPQIECSISGDGQAFADDSLSSVISNIINNAFLHAGTAKINITIENNDNWCHLKIADTGKGIPDELKEKVFEESFTHGKTGNTGLGLYIVKKAVESFGGSVYIEDNKPCGAVFNILLKKAGK